MLIFLYRVSPYQLLKFKCHAFLTVFPLNTRLQNGQLKEVTGSDVKEADTLTKMLEDIVAGFYVLVFGF